HSVIAACATRINSRQTSVILADCRIFQNQPASLVGVAVRRARVVRHAVQGAWTARNVDGGIERLRGPEMNGVVSQITRRYEPIGADLSLEAEIPLLNLHVRSVVIQCCSEGVKRPWRITADVSSEWSREGISAGLVRPRIFEAHARQSVSEIP